MKLLAVLLALSFAAPVLAQRERGHYHPPGKSMSQEDRRRIREDVDSARGSYERRDERRAERMAPEERERLRRDVQDASREMRRERRR
ncbi:MAG TPA: hypothetical protein VG873_17055 [Burkholderiales bacterium]|nr:hypothetical protein [Burkholderiales bacterium]